MEPKNIRDGLYRDDDGWWTLKALPTEHIMCDDEDHFKTSHGSVSGFGDYLPEELILPLELML